MKKIICLIDSLASGGAQRQLVELAKLLKDSGNDATVVYYHRLEFYKWFLDENGVNYQSLKNAVFPCKRVYEIYRYLKHESPDVVIAYLDAPSMIACVCRLLGQKFKLIVSERNTTQSLTRKDRIKFWLYRWADHIVPNSNAQAKFIERNFPKLSKKISVITNVIDTDKFSIKKEQPINPSNVFKRINTGLVIFNQCPPIPKIVTIGRVIPQKNILRYLEAVAEIKARGISAKFEWYGNKLDANYWDLVQRKIEELKIEDYVTFHDPVQDIVSVYHSSDIFILPSTFEGFPNVLCEAMSCGLPAVATDICDNPEILQDARFLPKYNNHLAIANSLEQILKLSPNERRKLGVENRKRIKGICSKETFIKKYLKLL